MITPHRGHSHFMFVCHNSYTSADMKNLQNVHAYAACICILVFLHVDISGVQYKVLNRKKGPAVWVSNKVRSDRKV